jgi:hypothetical protein
MTPDERAVNVCRRTCNAGDSELAVAIAAAVREAVLAEREACAKLAECRFNGDHGTAYIHAGVQIADAIRQRPAP